MLQKPLTDEEAFAVLQAGEEKGLESLFNRYYTSLTFYSTSVTGNAEASREISSEAFIKLWHNRGTIEEWRKVKPLLYRMVYNASVDYLRQQKTAAKRMHTLVSSYEETERAHVEKLIEAETYNRLYTLLQKLPPRARQIFRMFYFQKKAIKEIAAELGISVNTVKTQKLRAIHALKENQGTLYSFIVWCFLFI